MSKAKDEPREYKVLDKYDRVVGGLQGRSDVTKGKPTTVVTVSPLVGEAQTFIVETWRVKDEGDYILLQYLDSAGSMRVVIPPQMADAIARQRDALTARVRKRVAREQADLRKARGEVPAFLKGRKAAGQ